MAVDSRRFPVAKQQKQAAQPLFPSDYWERPPPRTKGDATIESIQLAVGQALNTWEYMEEELGHLCMLLANIKEDGKAWRTVYRLFGSIESSAGRRNALEALAEIYFWPNFEGKNKSTFKRLMDAVSDASRRRDDLAHGKAIYHGSQSRDGEEREEGEIDFFLVPSSYNTKRNRPFAKFPNTAGLDDYPFDMMRGDYRYIGEDIKGFIEKFRVLTGKISGYIHIATDIKAALERKEKEKGEG
jgi:hypothetical protein